MTYAQYEPSGSPQSLGAEGPWRVAIEYSNQGQAKPSTIVQVGRTSHADHATAMLAAKRAAFEFDPPDPWSPQGRQVFRDGQDGFLVIIEGATSTFHMSVRIVAEVTP
ncbi:MULTISPECIES: hypothetical protein [unclassified Nocardioides]|jgi:hypothetical protein|uniref:hypothetical protein n=1 Tax=unclassified Nocardioides TaxID=2615069 RepID=UPI0007037798|nr:MULTISPECIES: hypothetical protein [unclassified Nocardioides]KRC56668.1 hypothetical protein ASE19_02240 [Nocardioides sp. Root79]KRC76879.1 hypothetical protein ASE20_01110 [Nocardioides sp. Root240]